MAENSELHPADYAIFALTTLASLGIGLYHALSGSGQRSTSKYLVGDRSMGVLPVSLSFVVSFMSSNFMLGNPAEMYIYGIPALLRFLAIGVSSILAILITIPLLHPLGLTSSYEYFEMRYDSVLLRKIGSVLGMLVNLTYIGVVLYGPAIGLEAVSGLPVWGSVWIIGAVSIIYTAIGGFKAVIWTDVFQMLMMLLGLVPIFVKAVIDIGGFETLWQYNVSGRRIRNLQFSTDPTIRTSFWTCFFGGMMYWFSNTFNQPSVQRIVSMRHIRQAKRMLLCSIPGFYIFGLLSGLNGLLAYCFYSMKRCDPFEEGVISNSNEILPYFVMEIFEQLPGFPGLFLAALFSASLSTISSSLNSLTALTLSDFIKPVFTTISDTKATLVAKLLVGGFGIVGIGLSFLIAQVGGPVTQISNSLLGCLSGPNCGLFLLGAFFPWANKKGATVGVLSGVGITFWIALGGTSTKRKWLPPAPNDRCSLNESFHLENESLIPFHNLTNAISNTPIWTDMPYNATGLVKMYSTSFFWYPLIGILVTFLVGMIVSVITAMGAVSIRIITVIGGVVYVHHQDYRSPTSYFVGGPMTEWLRWAAYSAGDSVSYSALELCYTKRV